MAEPEFAIVIEFSLHSGAKNCLETAKKVDICTTVAALSEPTSTASI